MGPFDARFSRQLRFSGFGARGHQALASARVCVVGVGGLGSTLAQHLARAGVGTLRLVDRDVVEESNLPRQALFSMEDARQGRPKAEAAAAHLAALEGPTRLEACCEDLTRANVDRLLADVDLILDGLDQYSTRFLLGDWCHRARVPWVHGGAVGATGSVLRIAAGGAPCLRCLFEEPAGDQLLPTCETEGVLTPLPALIASLQACEAFRHFAEPDAPARLWNIDPWTGHCHASAPPPQDPDCPCCAHARYPSLEADMPDTAAVLCGRDVVQVHPERERPLDLPALCERWQGLGPIESTPHLARLQVDGLVLSVFRDGRALIQGTQSVTKARGMYARYVGH